MGWYAISYGQIPNELQGMNSRFAELVNRTPRERFEKAKRSLIEEYQGLYLKILRYLRTKPSLEVGQYRQLGEWLYNCNQMILKVHEARPPQGIIGQRGVPKRGK